MGVLAHHQRTVQTDKLIGSTAASTNYVHYPLVYQLAHLWRHTLGSLVIESKSVWQSCIGVTAYIIRCLLCQLAYKRFHLRGTKRAVQSYRKYRISAYACQKCIESLTRECSSSQIAHRYRYHYGQFRVSFLHHAHTGVDGTFRVQRVEYCLYQHSVNTAFHQRVGLLHIGIQQFVVSYISKRRIAYIWRHRQRFVGRTHRSCHKSWFVVSAVFVGFLASHLSSAEAHLPCFVLQIIVGLRNALTVKRVGRDDVGSGFQIFAIDVAYYLRACKVQLVAVSNLSQHGSQHGSHRSIEYQNPLVYDFV